MRILYVAEIVGKPGIYTFKTLLPDLRREQRIDMVIANGDGATGGFGIGKNHSIYLRKLGADVITTGDQIFFKKDVQEHIEKAGYLLRPANLGPETPGRGWRHHFVKATMEEGTPEADGAEESSAAPSARVDASGPPASEASTDGASVQVVAAPSRPDLKVAVISLLGQSGFQRVHASNPYLWLQHQIERVAKGCAAVIVDFHAQTTAETYTMFHHAGGMVTAVIGSGTRVQTADAQVMPSGLGAICDAGMTGSIGGIGGFAAAPEIRGYLDRRPYRSEESWENLELQGVILEVDEASGYLTTVEAIRRSCPAPPPSERGDGDERAEGEAEAPRRGGERPGQPKPAAKASAAASPYAFGSKKSPKRGKAPRRG